MAQQISTFSETEKKAAERYKWWVVYLVREKRRLEGITKAVQASAATAQVEDPPPTPEVLAAEEFLLRAEQEGEAAFPDPLTFLEDVESEDPQVAEAGQSEATVSESTPEFAASPAEDLSGTDDPPVEVSASQPAEDVNDSVEASEPHVLGEKPLAPDSSQTTSNKLRGKAAVQRNRAAKNGDDAAGGDF